MEAGMSGDDMTPKEILVELVLPKLEQIERAIEHEHEYNEQTYVRKDTVEAVDRRDEKVWNRKNAMAGMFGVGSAFIFEIIRQFIGGR
jgi:hypothetical protein